MVFSTSKMERPEEENASQTQGQVRGLAEQHQEAGQAPREAGPYEAGLWEGVENCEGDGLVQNPGG